MRIKNSVTQDNCSASRGKLNNDPRGQIFYPQLTLIKDSYIGTFHLLSPTLLQGGELFLQVESALRIWVQIICKIYKNIIFRRKYHPASWLQQSQTAVCPL